MGSTSIEWTASQRPDGTWARGYSWNPGIFGCSVASPACDNCYAASMANRLVAMGTYPDGITKLTKAGPHWSGVVKVAPKVNTKGLPKRGPAKVFTTSMADLFHADVPDGFIGAVFDEMRARPHLTFLVLTKRAERMASMAEWLDWPANAWAGVTAENQEQADRRIPWLLRVPAVRFLSMEPLLGPVDLTDVRDRSSGAECSIDALTEPDALFGSAETDHRQRAVHWVLAGGESGHRARPSHPDWFRSLRDQCAAAGVPFHFKQWGEWREGSWAENEDEVRAARTLAADGRRKELSEAFDPVVGDALVVRVGKLAAGRLLDGRTWDGVPEVSRG